MSRFNVTVELNCHSANYTISTTVFFGIYIVNVVELIIIAITILSKACICLIYLVGAIFFVCDPVLSVQWSFNLEFCDVICIIQSRSLSGYCAHSEALRKLNLVRTQTTTIKFFKKILINNVIFYLNHARNHIYALFKQ